MGKAKFKGLPFISFWCVLKCPFKKKSVMMIDDDVRPQFCNFFPRKGNRQGNAVHSQVRVYLSWCDQARGSSDRQLCPT